MVFIFCFTLHVDQVKCHRIKAEIISELPLKVTDLIEKMTQTLELIDGCAGSSQELAV